MCLTISSELLKTQENSLFLSWALWIYRLMDFFLLSPVGRIGSGGQLLSNGMNSPCWTLLCAAWCGPGSRVESCFWDASGGITSHCPAGAQRRRTMDLCTVHGKRRSALCEEFCDGKLLESQVRWYKEGQSLHALVNSVGWMDPARMCPCNFRLFTYWLS